LEWKNKKDNTELIQGAFLERLSLRGICPVFKLSFSTLYLLLNLETKSLSNFRKSVLPAQSGDVLEFDELCSFAGAKTGNVGFG
jgi:hypothetical protein